MRPRARDVTGCVLLLLGATLARAPTVAAWTCDPAKNTPVCTEPHTQSDLEAVSDGTAEIVVTWRDDRAASEQRAFARCLGASGEPDPLWPAGDVDVFDSEVHEKTVVSDGGGGVIVVRHEWTNNSFRAQRLDHEGNPAWGPNGVYVSNGSRSSTCTHAAAPDGEGGVLFAWVDHADDYVRVQRVNQTGNRAWGNNGQILINYPTAGSSMSVISDGNGGAIVAWTSDFPSQDVLVQNVRGSGTPVWGDSGVLVSTAGWGGDVHMVPGGSWGAILVWEEAAGLRAQRLDGEGTALWAPGGVAVSSHSSVYRLTDVISDGAGGAIVGWTPDGVEPHVQRLDPSGNRLWGSSGLGLSLTGAAAVSLASDGGQGAYAAWQDSRAGGSLYAQRVTSAGAVQWPPDGVQLAAAPGIQWAHVILADGAGGATAVWTDDRVSSDRNIYAQHVASDGRLDDQLENNESCVDARSIAPGPYPGLVLFDVDEDWYRVEILEQHELTVALAFTHAEGDIDVNLSEACGGIVAYSRGITNVERFTYVNAGPTRDFDLHVYLYSGSCNEYDMTIVQQTPTAAPEPVAVGVSALLWPVVPNPFRTSTVIGFSLPKAASVRIDVFDVLGRRVKRLVGRRLPAGAHETTWTGRDAAGTEVANGVYFYRLKTEGFERTHKMIKQR